MIVMIHVGADAFVRPSSEARTHIWKHQMAARTNASGPTSAAPMARSPLPRRLYFIESNDSKARFATSAGKGA